MNSHFNCAHRVKMDLFRRYGAIAAAGDRHLAEFTAPWYTATPERIREWKFSLTGVEWRIRDLQDRLRRLPEEYWEKLEEIRLRVNQPLLCRAGEVELSYSDAFGWRKRVEARRWEI